MESRVTSLLENILERLTKIETQQETQLKKQTQIGQVIERLDTIQNCLERQNHKQNLLHDKLSAVSVCTQMVEEKVFTKDKLLSDLSIQLNQAKDFTADQLSAISAQMESQMTNKFSTVYTQLEQEKVFMRDQLKEAQDEILHRLTELQQQNVSARSQPVSVGEEMKQLQATAGPNPVKETAEFCSQADGDVMDARLAKMSETLEQSVKAVTRAELVWLDNQTDQRISELSDKVGELAKETLKIVESIKQENKDMATEFQIDVSEEIRAQNEPIVKEIQKFLTETAEENRNLISQQREDMKTFYTEIVTKVEKTSAELPRTVDEVKKKIKDNMDKVKEEIIANTNTAIVKVKDEYIETQNQLSQDVQKQIGTEGKESMEKVTDEIGKVKEELCSVTNSECQKLREVLNSQKETMQNIQIKMESTVKESVDKVHTDLDKVHTDLDKVHTDLDKVHTHMHKVHTDMNKVHTDMDKVQIDVNNTKRDLFVLAERQSYKISRLLLQHGFYICDFYIENFRQLVRSDKTVESEDCLIKQFCTSVKGDVDFQPDGKLRAWLQCSKHHSELGSKPKSGVKLKVSVTIKDTSGHLPEVLLCEQRNIKSLDDQNSIKFVGEMSCDELIQKGYGQKEGYKNGALLLRYDIEVM